ncbi:hypothetical protein [Sandaracinus amylolyticus]|uniref:Uncharacterized protein n=1 Tax=Sandaracinus amylolyticus TaxID=927083 RepID=A0A0F6W3J1_9BACT|nr:hypothetical protein [Sandaracinus amylolyticus]AKF06492.1 hypothetical protein DB32_003641 [Sandaracinus amylolyticus]
MAVAIGVLAIGSRAEAQRMDLALSRLSVPSEGGVCPNVDGALVCADDDAWRRLATQFAGALIPPILLPAHTRGMRGIYFGVESSITGIDSGADYWARGTEGDTGTDRNRFVDGVLAWSRFNVRKGLPFGFEIGTNVGFLVNTSYWALGAEVRWSLLEGLRDRHASAYFPSLSVRGSVQTLLGDSEVNVTVPAVDVSIGERIIVADTVEISPYLGGQIAWVFADSELVDLTPEVDAFRECDPDPIPPGVEGHTGSDDPPYCRGSGADFNHNVVFPSLRSTRVRLFVGSQVRYEWFALTAAFAFDLLAPSDLDESLPSDLPRQWRVDVGAGVSY